MEAFLQFSWREALINGEGKDREIGATVEIARDVRGGQFDLYFCSTKCLRPYTRFCVNELDWKIGRERKRIVKAPKSKAIPAPLLKL